jgi:hypothetical protein
LVSNAEYFFVAAVAEFPVALLVDGAINNANHKKCKDSPYLKPMLGPIGDPLIRCVAALLAGLFEIIYETSSALKSSLSEKTLPTCVHTS